MCGKDGTCRWIISDGPRVTHQIAGLTHPAYPVFCALAYTFPSPGLPQPKSDICIQFLLWFPKAYSRIIRTVPFLQRRTDSHQGAVGILDRSFLDCVEHSWLSDFVVPLQILIG